MAEKVAKVRHNKPDDLDKVLSSHNILHFSAVTLLVASLASVASVASFFAIFISGTKRRKRQERLQSMRGAAALLMVPPFYGGVQQRRVRKSGR